MGTIQESSYRSLMDQMFGTIRNQDGESLLQLRSSLGSASITTTNNSAIERVDQGQIAGNSLSNIREPHVSFGWDHDTIINDSVNTISTKKPDIRSREEYERERQRCLKWEIDHGCFSELDDIRI